MNEFGLFLQKVTKSTEGLRVWFGFAKMLLWEQSCEGGVGTSFVHFVAFCANL
jgi:hypothetical protein